MKHLLWLLLLSGSVAMAQSGQPLACIRTLNRVDLEERQNKPMLGNAAANNQSLAEMGLVRALMAGLEQGKYPAYDPDRPGQTMRWPVVLARLAAQNGNQTTSPDLPSDDFEGVETTAVQNTNFKKIDFSACEKIFQFIADEKTAVYTNEQIYSIRYLEIIWVDPTGQLPERKICAFKYEDIAPLLEQVNWHSPYNDAETRTLREAFDLRLFRSYAIQMSGQAIQTLEESQRKSGQMIQYEHNLWQN